MSLALPWYVAALGAAIVWGVHYPLVDRALKKISPVSVLLLTILGAAALLPFFYKEVARDLALLRTLAVLEQLRIAAIALTSTLGSLLLFYSIGRKNATLASLIEISYPVFVALFAYLLFRERHLDANIVLGALLVFAGVALIIRAA